MCCRVSVQPSIPDIARSILATGQFKPQPYALDKPLSEVNGWTRLIEEEGVGVNVTIDKESVSISLSPAVSVYAGHHGKRRAAAVMLEIAARYAEKVDGEIVQHANVIGCTEDGSSRHLASYPSQPLQFDKVCNGWKAEFLTPMEEVAG